MLQDNKRCAVFGNQRIVEMPLVWPCHVWICAFGRKQRSGGESDRRFTPTSWGACRNERPW